jgi:hypothetical protein
MSAAAVVRLCQQGGVLAALHTYNESGRNMQE